MKTEFLHKYSEFNAETVNKRVNEMISIKNELINSGAVSGFHIRISTGNRKTGARVPSVNLIPVHTCPNSKNCASGCYDVRNVCFQKTVQKSRAINTAILETEPARYFAEIENYILKQSMKKADPLKFFRWHAGGDMVNRSYLLSVIAIADRFPAVEFLIFTKLYGPVNRYLDAGGVLPANLHLILSDWKNAEFDNRHNLPVSSPVWTDKNGNEIARGPHTTKNTVWCPGFCEECAQNCAGCFGLKHVETVLFVAH